MDAVGRGSFDAFGEWVPSVGDNAETAGSLEERR